MAEGDSDVIMLPWSQEPSLGTESGSPGTEGPEDKDTPQGQCMERGSQGGLFCSYFVMVRWLWSMQGQQWDMITMARDVQGCGKEVCGKLSSMLFGGTH